MSKVSIVIACSQAVVRHGFRTMLLTQDNLSVIGETSDFEQAVLMFRRLRPDVVLLIDPSTPRQAVSVIQAIRVLDAEAKLLVVGETEEHLMPALKAGANAFLLKDIELEDLLGAVRLVVSGYEVFGANLSNLIAAIHFAESGKTNGTSGEDVRLTNREAEVLNLIAREYTNQEIARILSISPRTVDSHRNSLMHKLGAKNAAGLVRIAVYRNLLRQ